MANSVERPPYSAYATNPERENTMGLAWYIAAENDVAGLETFFNGKSIAHADEAHLEHLCETLGVRPLMDFFSVDPDETEAQLHAYLDTDDEPLDTPEEEWFAAKDGLLTVRTLREYLDSHPAQLDRQQEILTELAEYQRILESLDQNNTRWHLAIDL
tara:strand:+ start:8943 stop:9416 length:474 start_codon:yes stop_codon:yes gene_type:complete